MKNAITIPFLATLALCLSSCTLPIIESYHSPVIEPNNHINTLNWEGAYICTLPCNDYTGTQVVVVLKRNHTFTIETKCLKGSSEINEYEGWFSWDDDGNTIKLEYKKEEFSAIYFDVEKDQLVMLDSLGYRHDEEESDRYVLRKIQDLLLEKKWRMTELMGEYYLDYRFHIFFKLIDQRVTGHIGCNKFEGKYEIEKNRAQLKCRVGRQYYCNYSYIETQFMKAFEMTDDLRFDQNHLWLFSNNNIVAKFELEE